MPHLAQQILLGVCLIAFAFYAMSIWARRDNLLYNLRKFVVCILIGGLLYLLMLQDQQLAPAAPFTAFLVGGLMYRMRPGRKRSLGAKTRRRVIAKWTVKSGDKFDPRRHEIDHVVPFSRGGSDTEDNLRVLDKTANRRKGTRTVWWDMFKG